MEIINQSRVDFHYRLLPSGPVICNTLFSNIVKTTILEKLVVAIKKVDKSTACIYDTLTYTICIINKSMYNISNVFFQDVVPIGEKFICNSVKVNNYNYKKLNPNCGFYIGTIKPFSTCVILFKVLILQHTIGKTIKNYAEITYDYIYNLEKPPIRVSIKTNITCTTVQNSLFKQSNISNKFKFRNACICFEDIISISTRISIVRTKILDTPEGISLEGVYLTGSKILIIGTANYRVSYFNRQSCKKCFQKFIGGFTSSIIIPKGINYTSKVEFNISTENTFVTPLVDNCFKADTTLLISLI